MRTRKRQVNRLEYQDWCFWINPEPEVVEADSLMNEIPAEHMCERGLHEYGTSEGRKVQVVRSAYHMCWNYLLLWLNTKTRIG